MDRLAGYWPTHPPRGSGPLPSSRSAARAGLRWAAGRERSAGATAADGTPCLAALLVSATGLLGGLTWGWWPSRRPAHPGLRVLVITGGTHGWLPPGSKVSGTPLGLGTPMQQEPWRRADQAQSLTARRSCTASTPRTTCCGAPTAGVGCGNGPTPPCKIQAPRRGKIRTMPWCRRLQPPHKTSAYPQTGNYPGPIIRSPIVITLNHSCRSHVIAWIVSTSYARTIRNGRFF